MFKLLLLHATHAPTNQAWPLAARGAPCSEACDTTQRLTEEETVAVVRNLLQAVRAELTHTIGRCYDALTALQLLRRHVDVATAVATATDGAVQELASLAVQCSPRALRALLKRSDWVCGVLAAAPAERRLVVALFDAVMRLPSSCLCGACSLVGSACLPALEARVDEAAHSAAVGSAHGARLPCECSRHARSYHGVHVGPPTPCVLDDAWLELRVASRQDLVVAHPPRDHHCPDEPAVNAEAPSGGCKRAAVSAVVMCSIVGCLSFMSVETLVQLALAAGADCPAAELAAESLRMRTFTGTCWTAGGSCACPLSA